MTQGELHGWRGPAALVGSAAFYALVRAVGSEWDSVGSECGIRMWDLNGIVWNPNGIVWDPNGGIRMG